jgi:hypothetical protein
MTVTPNAEGFFEFKCNFCDHVYKYKGTFKQAWKMAKDDGWISIKRNGVFTHKCPACAKKCVTKQHRKGR